MTIDQESSEIETLATDEQKIVHENKTENTSSSSDEKQISKFQKGELLTYVRVRFSGNSKSFPFLIGKRHFAYGQKVVAPSDRGMAVGYINSFPYEVPYSESLQPVKYINKIATEEDLKVEKDNITKEKNAEVICQELIEKYKLDMNLTHVEFTQFGKKSVFYFNSPGRVDFRSLIKDLVSELKMRIELRQISIRDRSASLGGIGACGRELCCASFLQKYGNVSIKMAKNQNLTLIGSKINGVCGQLKCCLQYEDAVYSHKRKLLPREGSFIKTENGDIGKVLKLQILSEQFDMLTDKGAKRRYTSAQYKHGTNPPKDYQFPRRFDHITNETSIVIGEKLVEETSVDLISTFKNSTSQENDIIKVPQVDQPREQKKNNNRNRNRKNQQNSKPRNNNNQKNQATDHKKPNKNKPQIDNNKNEKSPSDQKNKTPDKHSRPDGNNKSNSEKGFSYTPRKK